MELGKLESVNLREVWKHEAKDFTEWLANNLHYINNVIGMELELLATEDPIGGFNADIVCKNTISNDIVVIENQLEITDHDHLGKIITYGAGKDAKTLIWVAKNFRSEHEAAIDYLNRISDETFEFFGLEVKAYKIDGSRIAPAFEVRSHPNSWKKSISGKLRKSSQKTSSELLNKYYKFWNEFQIFMIKKDSFIRAKNPWKDNYTAYPMGRSDFGIYIGIHRKNNDIGLSLAIKGENNYEYLYNQKVEIEKILGKDIFWKKGKNGGEVGILRLDFEFQNEDEWADSFLWMKKHLEKFDNFFRETIKKLPR